MPTALYFARQSDIRLSASCGKYNITLTGSQNITQETCISLLAIRLKISLIIVYLLWIRKAHYVSLLVKYSVLYFYYGLKSLIEETFISVIYYFTFHIAKAME